MDSPVTRRPHLPSRPEDLPSNMEELKILVIELQHQVDYLKRMLFGRRSEKLHDDSGQGLLFSRPEIPEVKEKEEVVEEEEEGSLRRRRTRHRGRRFLPDHLPRHTEEIHPPESELTCPCCGARKEVFGQDATEELDVIPAKFFVRRYVRFKYACRKCQEFVSIAALPPRPMDKGIPGPGFLAQLITSKYADHVPLYRQQQIYRRLGLEIPRSTMCGWVSYVAKLLAPVVEAMKSSVMTSRKVHTDDTPITVLDPGIQPIGSKRGYMWVYIGDADDVVFEYTESRKRDGPESFLQGYRGYLQADAFSGYDRIYAGGEIVEVACWAHARRKFIDAQPAHGADARRLLDRIGRLYTLERRAKALNASSERLLAWRQRFARRRLGRLREELDALSWSVLPRSPLGEAIGYALNNWKALNRYTEAPFLSIDNNHSERQIKQMVIGRKNWLFAGSDGGARSAALLFSVIVSCKLAGVDPFAYLSDVLLRIHTHLPERIAELVPRQWRKRFAPQATASARSVA
jgi:transposase